MGYLAKLTLCCLGILWMTSCRSQEEDTIIKIDKETVEAKVIGKDVQLVDVRTPQEYRNGHIDDAVNFNVNDASFIEQINTLDKEQPVYLYCKMGGRSNRAAEILKSEGFTKIYDYTGGYADWESDK